MNIALLCGGPSPERGISLNSARSVLDHLESKEVTITPIYFDYKRNAYLVSTSQLYSNTPSDFDFKLNQNAKLLSKEALIKLLKRVDIVFPVIHGTFGEDGEIQSFLEENEIPFVGSGSIACKKAFDKYKANEFIKSLDFFTLPSAVLKIYASDHQEIIEQFFSDNHITRAIIKPASGGSSIGVFSVSTVSEALEKVEYLFSKRVDTRVVIEPFCIGTEFTVIILQNRFQMPVAILPTEIETDYTEHQIFDYRKKYLPTRQVTYHCPPRFGNDTIEKIQYHAEQIFTVLGMKDFARFDGWVLPDGNIWFSDFNPISGMEQNSFLFQQSSRLGFSHHDLLTYIVRNSSKRQHINFPENNINDQKPRKQVNVLFGGDTSERQVSLMSGTNVWLKLRKSTKYNPTPYLLDLDGNVWKIPYMLTINHTVEEIVDHAKSAKAEQERLSILETRSRLRLALTEKDTSQPFFLPEKMSLIEFVEKSPYIFIGLHGGIGENGLLQKMIEDKQVKFNGASSKASQICINKWETAQLINSYKITNVTITSQKQIEVKELLLLRGNAVRQFWIELKKELNTKSIIVKPIDDGCSSGIVKLLSADDLILYLDILKTGNSVIPANTFKGQSTPIEMPLDPIKKILFEKFIETDVIRVVNNELKIKDTSGWVEITVGVLGRKGNMYALSPSITIADGQVLSVEEKFQGGTGINITPPSKEIAKNSVIEQAKESITAIANTIGLKDYARIDAFLNRKTGEIILIEINTLPGLTPSTVIFHQALAEVIPLNPTQFIEKIIEYSEY